MNFVQESAQTDIEWSGRNNLPHNNNNNSNTTLTATCKHMSEYNIILVEGLRMNAIYKNMDETVMTWLIFL